MLTLSVWNPYRQGLIIKRSRKGPDEGNKIGLHHEESNVQGKVSTFEVTNAEI